MPGLPIPARARGPIRVVPTDPAVVRATVMAHTTMSVLATTFITALALTGTSVVATPLGWALVAGSVFVGLTPYYWHVIRSRLGHPLAVWHLPMPWAEIVGQAAEQAGRLRRMAERSPDGAVADHIGHLATTAENYVLALHSAAGQADPSGRRDPDLEEEAARLVDRLCGLSEAAERLRQAQMRHLEQSPLDELIDATTRLTEAIESNRIESYRNQIP